MKAENLALDTGAFSLHFANDPQVREIMNIVLKGDAKAHTCELNLAEHYHKTCEKLGNDIAMITTSSIRETPIQIHSPDSRLTQEAAILKCKYRGKISMIDSYILAVARMERYTLITTDSKLKEVGLVPVRLLEVH